MRSLAARTLADVMGQHSTALHYFAASKSSGAAPDKLKRKSVQLFGLLQHLGLIGRIFLKTHLLFNQMLINVEEQTNHPVEGFHMNLNPFKFSQRERDFIANGDDAWSKHVPISTPLEVPMPPVAAPAQARSVVGQAVVSLDRIRHNALDRIAKLDDEISTREEERRQYQANVRGLDAHLMELASDPALTAEEREMAEGPIMTAIEHLPEVKEDGPAFLTHVDVDGTEETVVVPRAKRRRAAS